MSEKAVSYMIFNLGGKAYAINSEYISEVLEIPEFTPIPKGLDYMLGVFNLGGKVVSLMNVVKKLNLESYQTLLECEVIVLQYRIEKSIVYVGILVDKILEVIEILPDKLVNHQGVDKIPYNKGNISCLEVDTIFKIE